MPEIPTGNSATGQAMALAIQTAVEKGPDIDRTTAETGQALLENLIDLANKAQAVTADMFSQTTDQGVVTALKNTLTGVQLKIDKLKDQIAQVKLGKQPLSGLNHAVQNGVALGGNTCEIIASELLPANVSIVELPVVPGYVNFKTQLTVLGFFDNGVKGHDQVVTRIPPAEMDTKITQIMDARGKAAIGISTQAEAYAKTRVPGNSIRPKDFTGASTVGVDARGREWNYVLTERVDNDGAIRHFYTLNVYCGSVLRSNGQQVDYRGRPYAEQNERKGLVHALQGSARGVIPTTPNLQ